MSHGGRGGGFPPPPPLSTSSIEIVHWCKTCWACVSVCHPSLPRGLTTLNVAPPPPPCLPPFLIGIHLCTLVTQSARLPPSRRPRGSGAPCRQRDVNRADGFWQIHSDWKSFILQDFFSLSFFMKPPKHKKSCPSICFKCSEVRQLVPWPLDKHFKGFD